MISTFTIIAIIVVSLLYLLPIIISSIKREGKWGLNFKRTYCPSCEKKIPIIRKPSSTEEALWGGYTCSCGCKMDKWGKKRK